MAFTRGCLVVLFLATGAQAQESDKCKLLQSGIASIYSKKLNGNPTANSLREEALDINEMTVAHRTLPFDTRIKIVDTRTGVSAYARVNDRGPFVRKRVLDVTPKISRHMNWGTTGLHPVKIYVCS